MCTEWWAIALREPFLRVSFPSAGLCPSFDSIPAPPAAAAAAAAAAARPHRVPPASQVVPHERLLLGRAEQGANVPIVLGARGSE
jgi:hypothetical protein